MQELRLVAVSEDGSYLVLATAGRGTRFTLPVDDRLRAVVRGHFSRLGQYEIEVESPLRPKEIQARIRAGETAEEIAESAGIPVERIRWFEGPVLQEREYMAQQAQRVTIRRQGESTPGPPLGEIVEERLGKHGVDLEEVEWDSRKREDGTWRVRLSFFTGGRPYAAEWVFDPRRRYISPLDEEAARLSSLELDESIADTVTPLLPRRTARKIAAEPRRDEVSASRYEPAAEPSWAAEPEPAGHEEIAPRVETVSAKTMATETMAGETAATETMAPETAAMRRPEPEPAQRPKPAPRKPAAPARAPAAKTAKAKPARPRKQPVEEEAQTAQEVAEQSAAAAAGAPAAAEQQRPRPRRKSSSRGKRASVPSWDEIMFGTRRPE